jgi:hypothetical protein
MNPPSHKITDPHLKPWLDATNFRKLLEPGREAHFLLLKNGRSISTLLFIFTFIFASGLCIAETNHPIAVPQKSLPKVQDFDWEDVASRFEEAPTLVFQQSWRTEISGKAIPSTVRILHDEEDLWVFADLKDKEIFNPAKEFNQMTTTEGDVLEIFLRPENQETYYEFHVTPDSVITQFRWTIRFDRYELAKARKKETDFLCSKPLFQSKARIQKADFYWQVLARIPLQQLLDNPQTEVKDWRISFARYNHSKGRKPILSSTSMLKEPSFHRIEEWTNIRLAD